MVKYTLTVICLFACLNASGQINPSFEFEKIYAFALQEDVKKVLAILDTLPKDGLTDKQMAVRQKYFDRFSGEREEVDEGLTDDADLKSLLKIYQDYWKKVLLDKSHIEKYDEALRDEVLAYLNDQGYRPEGVGQQELERNFNRHLKMFLENRDYYSATGRTGSLFDLFFWPEQDTTVYQVELPEREVETTIVFIEDPVTMGWQEFATFGRSYPGGWATKEMLYSVRKAYDTDSENFKVSYLTHEAQHFADYQDYPNLTGADLEYRAKLTELVYARETLYNLIRTFVRNSSSVGRNAHAFANYAVIRDLSREIFEEDFVSDVAKWEQVSPEKISERSKDLLKTHSERLQIAGAESVRELIQ